MSGCTPPCLNCEFVVTDSDTFSYKYILSLRKVYTEISKVRFHSKELT